MNSRLLALVAATALCATPVLASGGVSCSAGDREAKFTVGSPVARSMGGAFFQFAGEIELHGATVPADFRKVAVTRDHLAQNWFDARELKMRVYFERQGEPHGTIELLVEARGHADAETWRGRYTLSIGEVVDGEFRTRRLTGRVSCSVEG